MIALPFLIGLVLLALAMLSAGTPVAGKVVERRWGFAGAVALMGLRFWVETFGFALGRETEWAERLVAGGVLALLAWGAWGGGRLKWLVAVVGLVLGVVAAWIPGAGVLAGVFVALAVRSWWSWSDGVGRSRVVERLEWVLWGLLGASLAEVRRGETLLDVGPSMDWSLWRASIEAVGLVVAATLLLRRAWLVHDEALSEAKAAKSVRPKRGAWAREWVAAGVLVLALLEVGGHHRLERLARAGVETAVRLVAAGVDAAKIEGLEGVPEERDTTLLAELEATFTAARQQLPDVITIYLAAMRRGELVYLAEGEPLDDPERTEPGEVVESEDKAIWLEVLSTGRPRFSPPSRDEWGLWVSAFAPVFREGTGEAVALVGLDVDADAWQRATLRRQFLVHALVLGLAGLWGGMVAGRRGYLEWGWRMEALSRKLANQEEGTRELMRNLPHGLLIADGEGRICYANEAVALLAGELAGKIIGGRLKERLELGSGVDGGSDREGKFLAEEGWIPVLVRTTRQEGEAGREVYSIIDLRARRRQEEEMARRRRDLEKMNRCLAARGVEFSSNVRKLTLLAGELSKADLVVYYRRGSGVTAAYGAKGASLEPEALPGWVAPVCEGWVEGGDGLLRPMTYSEAGDEAKGMSLGFSVASGEAVAGALCLFFLREDVCSDSGLISVEMIAAAIGREELIEQSRARLSGALAKMEREKARLGALLTELDGAVVFEDVERRLVWVNGAARRLFGDTINHDPDGREFAVRIARLCAQPDEFLARIQRLIGDGYRVAEDIELLDGRVLLRSFTPVSFADSGLDGYLWHYREVTSERKAARIFAAVAGLGTTLLGARMDAQDWAQVLGSLGRAAGADRAYVFRHFADEKRIWRLSQIAEWNSGVAEPQIENPELQNLAMEEAGYGRWHEAFIEDDLIMGSVADFPASERELLAAQQIKSLLVVPIKVGGEPWGVLGFDDCRTEREWADWEVALLRSVATTIGLRLAQLEREVALRQARDEAETANRAKSAFLATMSHEIRTPLNAVIGMASLFEETSLDAQHRDYIRTILNSSQALLDVINDILDYSKIESGKIELEAVPFHLSSVCAQACDILRGQARAKGIELVSRSASGGPDFFIGDPTRLRQVVLNLLSNAIKFTPRGSVTLAIELATGLDARGHWPVRISVRDTGIGMSEEVRARLFQPFTQGDATTTRRFGGTGLGLVITRRLVETMGGAIAVTSTAGEGSLFTIELPLVPAPADAGLRVMVVPGELPAGLRALVVDDLAVNRELLVEWLGSWGVNAVAVAGAPAALEHLRSGKWNLLLTDYHMPDMDGGELLERMEALRLETPPVAILLSSDSTVPTEVRARCAAVKVKPLWPGPLRQMIAECVASRVPAKVAAPEPVAPAAPQSAGALRVLVAEDNPQNQKVVLLMLKRHGITPTLANNGVEAVAAAEREVFDLAMLDMQMPEMDGLEAARRIRRLYPDEAVRPLMVAFTANVFAEEREAARQAGLPHFVTKPMTNAQLTEVLRLAEAHRAARGA